MLFVCSVLQKLSAQNRKSENPHKYRVFGLFQTNGDYSNSTVAGGFVVIS